MYSEIKNMSIQTKSITHHYECNRQKQYGLHVQILEFLEFKMTIVWKIGKRKIEKSSENAMLMNFYK